jgi:hypothetical protein
VRCVQPSVLRPFYTTGWCEAANLGVIAAGGDAMVQCGVIPSIAHSTGVRDLRVCNGYYSIIREGNQARVRCPGGV